MQIELMQPDIHIFFRLIMRIHKPDTLMPSAHCTCYAMPYAYAVYADIQCPHKCNACRNVACTEMYLLRKFKTSVREYFTAILSFYRFHQTEIRKHSK